MADRYSFTNFTNEPFTGRYGGIDYLFAPGEIREFDPDKHYMLKLLAKQLADKELLKGIRNVGRNPNDQETFGESLGADGKKYIITVEGRIGLMRKAIGELADKPVPIPEGEEPEVGATLQVSTDVKTLQEQVQNLTEMVQSMAKEIKKTPKDEAPKEAPVEPTTPSMSTTREILAEMAEEAGISVTPDMAKEEIVELLSKSNHSQLVQVAAV